MVDDFTFVLDVGDGSPVEFGLHKDVFLVEDGWDTGTQDVRSQDLELPNEDGLNFGRDFLTPPSWTFELATNGSDEASSLAMMAPLAKAWKSRALRDTPTARAMVRYGIAGRSRRVYGRPRQFATAYDNRILSGTHQITAAFQLADSYYYDDGLSSLTIDILPAEGGAFAEFPIEFPLSTNVGTERDGGFTVGGDSPTWPRILFTGPVLNPYVMIEGKKIAVNYNLIAGRQVVIDTAPWARTVQLFPGASNVSGSLTRDTRMNDMALDPGSYELAFGGVDPSGTAKVTIQWRNAWSSL